MPTQIFNLKSIESNRRLLRKNTTKAEQLLWYKVRNRRLGFKFRRQYSIGKYIVDFCCPELCLIIEIDGDVHYSKESKIKKDSERQKYLKSLGFRMIRFTNNDVLGNLDNLLEKLKSNFI